MGTTAEIVNKLDRFKAGYVFTYAELGFEPEKTNAVIIALNRLIKEAKIERLSKGRFYKPRQGIVGNLKPDEYEVIKNLLNDGRKPIGYITGYYIFNSLKLTTQVPNAIQIGVNFDKKGIKRNNYRIKFVRQWNTITKANIPLLQLLDCLRFIKTIPDTTLAKSLNRIIFLVNKLSDSEKKQLVDLAVNYPPSTRALTGAIFELSGFAAYSKELQRTLKSSTWYSFNISEEQLPNKLKWKIK